MSDLDPASRDSASPRSRGPAEGRRRWGAPTVAARAGSSDRTEATTVGPSRFDADQARRAWRQFARARGAAISETEATPRRWGPWLFLALGVAAAAMVYQSRSGPAARPAVASAASGRLPTAARPASTPPPTMTTTTTPGTDDTAREAADPLARRQPRPHVAPKPSFQAPSPFLPKLRDPPRGTPQSLAAALQRVPRSRSDRAPIGGVGVYGVHVDRIVVGPGHEDRSCGVARRILSQSKDGAVQVCFRVVHQRRAQRLLVHWLHGDELVRRTFLSVPAERAYRTRAWIPLPGRGARHGQWTAVVKTDAGVELARIAFEVSP